MWPYVTLYSEYWLDSILCECEQYICVCIDTGVCKRCCCMCVGAAAHNCCFMCSHHDTHREILGLLSALALVALLVPTEAQRGGFTLPTTSTTTTPKPISCSSVLVKLNPSLYPHCCSPGPWKFVREEAAPTSQCASGRRYVLTRKTCPGKPGTRTVCEYTTHTSCCE